MFNFKIKDYSKSNEKRRNTSKIIYETYRKFRKKINFGLYCKNDLNEIQYKI